MMARVVLNAEGLQKRGLRVRAAEMFRRSGSVQGSAIVEFALSAVILLALIFGVIGMCLATYAHHFISDAAREGTRYAMVRGSSCATYGNFSAPCPVTTSAQVQTYVRSLTYPGIDSNSLNVTATWPTTGGACTPSVSPCNNPGNLVKVTVSYAFPLIIPFIPARTLTMTSTSQMVIAD